jgi:hypothetical protein
MLQIKNVCGCFLLSALCSSSLGHSHALTAEHRTEEQGGIKLFRSFWLHHWTAPCSLISPLPVVLAQTNREKWSGVRALQRQFAEGERE